MRLHPLHLRDPFADLDREFARLRGRGAAARPAGAALDVVETEQAFRVLVDLPGRTLDEIEISLLDRALTLKVAAGAAETSEEARRWHRRERSLPAFEETLRFPVDLDQDAVEAKLEAGVLEIRLPKAAGVRPRSIPIRG